MQRNDTSIDDSCCCAPSPLPDVMRARAKSLARTSALILGLTVAPFFAVAVAQTYHQATRPTEVRTLEKIERHVGVERNAEVTSQVQSLETSPAVVNYRRIDERYQAARLPVVLLAFGGVMGSMFYLFKKLSEPL